MASTVIEVQNLVKQYPIETSIRARLRGKRRHVHAVDDVSFNLRQGEIFGIAGESGCGKTTTARCVSRLEEATTGQIIYNGTDITEIEGKDLKEFRQDVQVVFQDPYAFINERFTIRRWIAEPLQIHGIGTREEREAKVVETLEQCGLRPGDAFLDQYPHELSGGQRQRVALARALVLDPNIIVADEPTSMLDVSVRAGVLKVMKELVDELNVTILYISHDLSLLRYICDRIAIMYRGQLAEVGAVESVLQSPKHPYTQSLLRAVPRLDPSTTRERVRIPPDVDENIGGIQGCPFKDRCPYEFELCDEDVALMDVDVNQRVACHLYDESVDEPIPEYP